MRSNLLPCPLKKASFTTSIFKEQRPSGNGDREAIVVGAGLCDGENERAYTGYTPHIIRNVSANVFSLRRFGIFFCGNVRRHFLPKRLLLKRPESVCWLFFVATGTVVGMGFPPFVDDEDPWYLILVDLKNLRKTVMRQKPISLSQIWNWQASRSQLKLFASTGVCQFRGCQNNYRISIVIMQPIILS